MNSLKKEKAINIPGLLAQYGVYVVFLILCIAITLSNDKFFTVQNLMNILWQAAPLGIVAIGMIFVLSTGGIDISVGQTMLLCVSIVGVILSSYRKTGTAINWQVLATVVALSIAIGALVGLLNGFLVTKAKLIPFIATLGSMSIARGVALITTEGKIQDLKELIPIGGDTSLFLPTVVIIQLILTVIFHMVYTRTPFGRNVLAVGNNEESARKLGINVARTKMICYVILGALTGLGAIMSAGQVGTANPQFAKGNEFLVISGAVIGGTSLFGGKGNVLPGALIGMILVYTILNGLVMIGASPYFYTIVRGLIIFIAIMTDSFKRKGDLR